MENQRKTKNLALEEERKRAQDLIDMYQGVIDNGGTIVVGGDDPSTSVVFTADVQALLDELRHFVRWGTFARVKSVPSKEGHEVQAIIDKMNAKAVCKAAPDPSFVAVARALANWLPDQSEHSVEYRAMVIEGLLHDYLKPPKGGRPRPLERDVWIVLLYTLLQHSKPERGALQRLRCELAEFFSLSEERISSLVKDKELRALAALTLVRPDVASDIPRLTSLVAVPGGLLSKGVGRTRRG